MLTFNVVLGYQGLLFRDFLWFCFLVFFFQSDRPTQYQETHSTLNEEKKRGWPYGASFPVLILLVPNKFTNRWFCRYLRIAAIIVLDGQSPAKAWSAPLKNEVQNHFPEMQSEELRSSSFNNWQPFPKESMLFCIWLPPKNGTACFPFRELFSTISP